MTRDLAAALRSLDTARAVRLTRDDLPLEDVPPPPGWERGVELPASLLLSQRSTVARLLALGGLPMSIEAAPSEWDPGYVRCVVRGCRARLAVVLRPPHPEWTGGPVLHASLPPSDADLERRRRMARRRASRRGIPWRGFRSRQDHPYLVLIAGSATPRYLPVECRDHGPLLVDRDRLVPGGKVRTIPPVSPRTR